MPTYLHGALSAHLPPLRLVSRASQEYAGACPFCGGDERRSDRFHVWLTPTGRERYWCRRCNRKGPASELTNERPSRRPSQSAEPRRPRMNGPTPRQEHIPHYRALYALVATWAEANLHQPWNPEPLAYLRQRGFDLATMRWARLGYALRDPQSLVTFLERHVPWLLPYAEEAGVLTRDEMGETAHADRTPHAVSLRTHPNLCGRIVIPYLSAGEVCDLRTRRFPGKGYASLPGSYAWRGATVPLGWDATRGSEVVIITEGEFKALAATAAFRVGALPYPAIGHPGLNYFRPAWATALNRQGVRVAILAYDARATRPRDDDGHEHLAPEEAWTIRHGATLAAAGLQVLVLTLPLEPGAAKEDLDNFLLIHGPAALTWHLQTHVRPLAASIAALPRALLRAAGLDHHLGTA
ncbi:hypothetical protein [Candidatus Chloroploca asiatica]|uniref:DNA primase/helicase Gp4 N-terminal Bacteriophage T7-like domain-containing protein n=1 Tax=Candidatus Chloroploca asiatica TaxID=1506545 RepID=A0A2H3KZ77_9CHLR|nr:hypothetical protein [Candidatus Chloroploca asiatica]PDW00940.1 hypothetical protein A9Q02_21480 [Candidatus Chloroploca asiatica]